MQWADILAATLYPELMQVGRDRAAGDWWVCDGDRGLLSRAGGPAGGVGPLLAPLGLQTVRGLDLGQVEPTNQANTDCSVSHGLWSWEGDSDHYSCPTVDSCLNRERARLFARVYPSAVAGTVQLFTFDQETSQAVLVYTPRPGPPTQVRYL